MKVETTTEVQTITNATSKKSLITEVTPINPELAICYSAAKQQYDYDSYTSSSLPSSVAESIDPLVPIVEAHANGNSQACLLGITAVGQTEPQVGPCLVISEMKGGKEEEGETVKMERVWAMPNKWTFTIPPIRQLLSDEGTSTGLWADPFAGQNSPATVTNDLNPANPATSHIDALQFLKGLESDKFDGVLFDPPYSITQAKQCYDDYGKDHLSVSVTNMAYWKNCKNEVARIIKVGGKAICFGWSSMGLGINRDFKMTRILLVPHGGSKNDTICTVEVKNS